MISTIYSKKVMSDAIDEICETDPQHLPEFVEDGIIQSYGVGPLAAKRLADMYAGVRRHMAHHPRIRLFALISGIQDNGAAYGGKASKVFIKFISKACLDSYQRSTGHSAAAEYTGPGSAARRASSAALGGAGRSGSPGGAEKGEAGGRRRSPMSVFEDDTRHAAAKMVSHAIQSCFSKTASKAMLHRRSILKSVAASLDGEMPRAAIQSVVKRLDGITEGMNSSSGAGGGVQKMGCLDLAAEMVMDSWFEQQGKHVEYLAKAFVAFDENRDGVLSAEEFQEVVAVVMPAGDRRVDNPRAVIKLFKAASERCRVTGEVVITPESFAETMHEYITHDTCR